MRTILAILGLLLSAVQAAAAERAVIRIDPTDDRRAIDLTLRSAPVESALRRLEIHLGRRIVFGTVSDVRVDYEARRIEPERALREIVRIAGLTLDESSLSWIVRDPAENEVSFDVVDEDARRILERIGAQCGYRNVVIEPGVSGLGTFRFHGVPCSVAMEIVLGSIGLDGRIEPNSVFVVERRR